MIKVNDNEVIKWAAGSQPINRAYNHDNLIFPEFSGTVPPRLPAGFVFNFNARDYDPATRTIPAEDGALETNAFILGADPVVVSDDSLTIDSYNNHSMVTVISTGKTGLYSINGTDNRAATWIFKFGAYGSEHAPHFLSNRTTTGNYNWMVRTYTDEMHVCLHDSFNHCDLSLDGTYPVIAAITVKPENGAVTMRNITEGTAVQPFNFDYGRSNATPVFFAGYSNYTASQEWYQGMFYWCFFANRCLTDDEVTQVINYNEN